MQPFQPLFRNPHVATIAGNFWPRNLDLARFPVRSRLFPTEPFEPNGRVRILVDSQEPAGPARAQLIAVHGLEGSSQAGYAQSLAQAALTAGIRMHRFNMRSCGGTEAHSGRTLYHSGQTADLLAVARRIKDEGPDIPLFLAGFSLGGNVVLKLAGEMGASAEDLVAGFIGVSTPIDLAACVRELVKPSNFVYADRFVTRLKDRIRRKEALTPGLFNLGDLAKVKTVYDFDDLFTARSFGFGTADNYYATQSANRFLEGIRAPTLVVHAEDDPLIPFEVYGHPALRENPAIRFVAVKAGGHLGFLARRQPRFWLDELLVEWLRGQLK